MNLKIVTATKFDQPRLAAISRTHRAGQGFTHMMFSGEAQYAKGWLRAAMDENTGLLVAFTCVRQKVRVLETKLYYIMVDPEFGRQGIGQLMLDDLIRNSPKPQIALDCLKDNAPALAFYAKNGFEIVGESLKGKGHHLVKKLTPAV